MNIRLQLNECLAYCTDKFGDLDGPAIYDFYLHFVFLPLHGRAAAKATRRKEHLQNVIKHFGIDHVRMVFLDLYKHALKMTKAPSYNERYLLVVLENFDRTSVAKAVAATEFQQRSQEKINNDKNNSQRFKPISDEAQASLESTTTPIRSELKYPEEDEEYNQYTYTCSECGNVIGDFGIETCPTCGLIVAWREVT